MSVDSEFDLAIVGMACRFPGARNVAEFWKNLVGGAESITHLSDEEILESGVPKEYLADPRYVKASPLLDEPDAFDAAFFGFAPAEAKAMDPQHRILLELAHEALENAGYDPERGQARIGVFSGSAMNTYFGAVGLNRRFTEDYIPTLIGNDKDFLSTRISYKLNLKGPSITVQTACSTSLVAVHLAGQSLLSEEADMALAGAISVRVPHRAGYFCDGGGIVSPDGHVRAFDAKANGTVFGSGGGVLVLKRLKDALADGDTIHAVIKGSAVNNDGSEKAGYTAPSVNSQADAVVEALANAGVDASDISYVEAHGSGTPIGDTIELRALTKAFRTFTQRSGYCAIGSVKTNVGHLDAAAGIAGMIKTALALKHRMLPPSLHFNEPNPEIDFSSSPFHVNTELCKWIADGPRRAGVMATGMGGTNAFVVMEEPPQVGAAAEVPGPHLLVLSAKTEGALDQATRDLREFLRADESANISDVAHTLQLGRKAFPHRMAVGCDDREDAFAALGEEGSKRIRVGRASDSRRPIVFLLPGIADHYVGMGHGLYENIEVFRAEVDRCAEILESHLGADIREILYPASQSWKKAGQNKGIDLRKMLGRGTDGAEDPDTARLNKTLYAQPALFTIEYAMSRLWQSLGMTPDAIVGHSMGEYVAACLAGVMSLDDALTLISVRAQLVSELPEGNMLAVTLREEELFPLLTDELSISLVNGPELCVVAGPAQAVVDLQRRLDADNVISRPVRNAHAFHSRMLAPIEREFAKAVGTVSLSRPTIPYSSNVTGKWITPDQATSPDYWASHATQTARFSSAIRELKQFEDPILLEVGPGRTLGVLAMQHPELRDTGHPQAVASIRHGYDNQSDLAFLLSSIGELWVSGVDIGWHVLHHAGRRRRIPLPTYPFERRRHWIEMSPGTNEAVRTDRAIHKNPDPSEWLYVPSWKRMAPRRVGASETASYLSGGDTWLVFTDDCGLSASLVERLEAAGQRVLRVRPGTGFEQVDESSFVIDPTSEKDYATLIDRLQARDSLPASVVHAWSVTGARRGTPRSDGFDQTQAMGFYSLLRLTQAFAARCVGHSAQVTVLSDRAQLVTGAEEVWPEKATLLGLCTVIRQEYSNLHVSSLDVDVGSGPEDLESAADLVMGELCDSAGGAPFIAHRNGHRWTQVFERMPPAGARRRQSAFRQHGVYLITGGLGRVGRTIASYLADKYHAKLALVGRTRPGDIEGESSGSSEVRKRPEGEDERTGILEGLRNLGGEVLYMSADVGDRDEMQAAVEMVYERFGTLHGVIHGAGVVGDEGYCEIKDCGPEDCEQHFRAKARGLLILEDLLNGRELDFLLVLSSLASVLGGIGQAAYTASNVYMDAFVHRHNRSKRTHWQSVNWDVWRVDAEPVFAAGLGATLQELGVNATEAIELLETALSTAFVPQIVVSTGDLNDRITQWVALNAPDTARPTNALRRTGASDPGQTREDAPRDETESQIARIWEDALGVESVGIHDTFGELGGTSLLAIKIVTDLRRTFQVDLALRALFDAPTVAELSGYINALILSGDGDPRPPAGAGRVEIEL